MFRFAPISILLFILWLPGCTYDTEVTDFHFPPELKCDFDVGSFSLLESSLNYLPYAGKSRAIYVDSTGSQMELLIHTSPAYTYKGALIKYNVFETGDTIRYCYESESTGCTLLNSGLDISFSLSVSARTSYQMPDMDIVGDFLDIYFHIPGSDPWKSIQVFQRIIAQRTYPGTFQNLQFSQLEIFGRTFTDVERTDYAVSGIPSIVYFNRTEGIVSFTDTTGKTWRFEGME